MDEQRGVYVPELGLTVCLPEGEGDALPLAEGLKQLYSPEEVERLMPEAVDAVASALAEARLRKMVVKVNKEAGKLLATSTKPKRVPPPECPECFRQDGKHNSRCPKRNDE